MTIQGQPRQRPAGADKDDQALADLGGWLNPSREVEAAKPFWGAPPDWKAVSKGIDDVIERLSPDDLADALRGTTAATEIYRAFTSSMRQKGGAPQQRQAYTPPPTGGPGPAGSAQQRGDPQQRKEQ